MLKPMMKARVWLRCWISVLFPLVLMLAAPVVNAQTSVTDGRTPLGMAAGAPAGSYSLSDLDDVNLFSGNLSFAIPLIKIGGRGFSGLHHDAQTKREQVSLARDTPNSANMWAIRLHNYWSHVLPQHQLVGKFCFTTGILTRRCGRTQIRYQSHAARWLP
jgi:hypothetical protein